MQESSKVIGERKKSKKSLGDAVPSPWKRTPWGCSYSAL